MKDKIYDFLDKCSCEGSAITVSLVSAAFQTMNTIYEFTVVNEDEVIEILCGDTYYSIDCNTVDTVEEEQEGSFYTLYFASGDYTVEICRV